MKELLARLQLAMRSLRVQVLAFSALALVVAICIRFWQVGLAVLIWLLVALVVFLVLFAGQRRQP